MQKQNLPVIILKGIVLLPHNDVKLDLDLNLAKDVLDEAEYFHNDQVLVVNQVDNLEQNVNIKTLPRIGVLAKITHKIEMPNHKIRFELSGIKRVSVKEYIRAEENIESIVEDLKEIFSEQEKEKKYVDKLKRELEEYIHEIPYAGNSILTPIQSVHDLSTLTDMIAPYLSTEPKHLNEYLLELDIRKRFIQILQDMHDEISNFQIETEIDKEIQKEIDKSQREYILREKIKVIKKELGEESLKEEEVAGLYQRVEELKAKEEVKQKIKSEIKRYEMLPIASPEVDIIRNYIDTLLKLPWENYTVDNDDLLDVKKKLDETHSGLEEVKTRIIEYLAVKQMTNSLRGPIICLVGPPGVGKTTLAFSIANAMNRNFVKISVGGITDEAELIGHRRTYIGANPGRIISSLTKANSSNPVFLIDEIDKMLRNYKGDPASVLLGILDPEQNKYFSDNYVELEYDLSKVMFIATANYLEDIPEALRDRLEIVHLSGYTEYEKVDIAKNCLLPRICKEHGINYKGVELREEVLLKIIREYTKEAGVRELDRILSTIIRKIVTTLAQKRIVINKIIIDYKKVTEYLGEAKYPQTYKQKNEIGVVNGLAYTVYGGDVLKIEVNYYKGKGNLILTGSLGNVMKESAEIALSYIKANAKHFGIDYNLLLENDIHIHVPEGAIKKDGPSAGISLTTAILSALKNKKIPSDIAFTGEITLRGNVLAIGGLKEKSIGAHRNKVKIIFIPSENIIDLNKIPDYIKKEITYIPVKNYKEIYKKLMEDSYEGI